MSTQLKIYDRYSVRAKKLTTVTDFSRKHAQNGTNAQTAKGIGHS